MKNTAVNGKSGILPSIKKEESKKESNGQNHAVPGNQASKANEKPALNL